MTHICLDSTLVYDLCLCVLTWLMGVEGLLIHLLDEK